MRALTCLAALCLLACADAAVDPDADARPSTPPPIGGGGGAASGVGGVGGGAGGGAGSPEDPFEQAREAFCEGVGPILDLGNAQGMTRQTCAGAIAEQIFAQSVCVCRDARTAGYVRTRGFDSRLEAAPDDEDDDAQSSGASFGVNGGYLIGAGFTDVGGPFTVAGAEPLSFIGYLKVAGDLRLQPETLIPGYTRVGRDAWLASNFTSGPLEVGRDVHHGGLLLAVPTEAEGETIFEPVAVAPPCACEAPYDIAGFVDQARALNDNASIGLDPDALKQALGEVALELPCGRYYLSEISGVGIMEVRVTGRVAVMVDGPVATLGRLEFELGPEAELDVFIKGNLGSVGNVRFGDEDRPSASRVYVASAEDVILVGASAFVGNLYAPHARVTAPGFLRVFGALFAGELDVAGYLNVAYDRAVTDLRCPGEPIPEGEGQAGGGGAGPIDDGARPDSWGDVCNGCGAWACLNGLSCLDGTCAGCRADEDCCHQQVCVEGLCRNYTDDASGGDG